MKNKGFTLIEFLIIVALIALLAIVAWVSLTGIRQKSRDTKRLNDMQSLYTAMKIVKDETGSFLNCCGPDFLGPVSQCTGEGAQYQLDNYIPAINLMNDPSGQELVCTLDIEKAPCNYNFIEISEQSYQVKFCLERGVKGYDRGCYLLSQDGLPLVD